MYKMEGGFRTRTSRPIAELRPRQQVYALLRLGELQAPLGALRVCILNASDSCLGESTSQSLSGTFFTRKDSGSWIKRRRKAFGEIKLGQGVVRSI